MTSPELLTGPGYPFTVGDFEISAGISDDDGVPVVFIDGGGDIRVYVNDCPVFVQNTESPSRLDYASLDR
jgi:hypothetical protein